MSYIPLDKNENLYPHSPAVLDYLQNIPTESLSIYNPSIDPVMERLSDIYDVPLDSLVLANGGEEILQSAIWDVVKERDLVLLPEGSWAYYRNLVESAGGKVEYFALKKESQRYLYDIPLIISLLEKSNFCLLILGSPNNPTGHTLSPEELRMILSVARQRGTLVLLDEAYMGFGGESLSYRNIREDYPHLLVLRTFSKFFALAGLRIAFAFFGSQWVKLNQYYQRYLGFSHLSSDIALKALESFDHYQENAGVIMEERAALISFFHSQNITVFDSYANFLLCSLSPQLFEKAPKYFLDEGVKIKFFSAQKEPYFESCIRITIGQPQHNRKVREASLKLFHEQRKT